MARKSPIARVGNYSAPAEKTGDEAMDETLGFRGKAKGMDKTEKAYVAGRGGAASATEAVRKARKANKKPPLDE